jgi:phospholipid N-methyltransferase
MIARDYRRFFSEFVCNPKAVSSVAPSSSSLARNLVQSIDWNDTSVVVEYGPGTGAITQEVVSKMRPEIQFLAIEINSRFADMLRDRFPNVHVCEGSVEEVDQHCRKLGIEQVDAVLSGLPWASFSDEDQTAYLDATMKVLRPGGQFVAFGYLQGRLLPSGRRFRRKLESYFDEVRVSKPVWINLPPAFFYCCRR